MGQDSAGQDRTTLEAAPCVALGSGGRVVINFYHGNGVRVAELGEGQSLVVGRAKPADVQIDVQSLSRRHARFTREGEGVWVEDLGSRNGTVIDGCNVARAEVPAGAVIALGGVTAVVHRLPAGAANAPELMSYERFGVRLASELQHVRAAGGTAAVLMVRSEGAPADTHVSRWAQRWQTALGPRDFSAMYDQSTLLVLRVGVTPEVALSLAGEQIAAHAGVTLYCGVSCYPSTATTGQDLLYEARQACLAANAPSPVRLATPVHDGDGEPLIV